MQFSELENMIKVISRDDGNRAYRLPEGVDLLCILEFTGMTNGILCTTDLTESSKTALQWSVRLAKKLKSPLTILFTYRLFKENGKAVEVKKKMEEDAYTRFRALEKEILSDAGISYQFKTEIGFVDDRISEHVRNSKTSFLVMGKNMSVDSKETFDSLVDQLKIPVIIVP